MSLGHRSIGFNLIRALPAVTVIYLIPVHPSNKPDVLSINNLSCKYCCILLPTFLALCLWSAICKVVASSLNTAYNSNLSFSLSSISERFVVTVTIGLPAL